MPDLSKTKTYSDFEELYDELEEYHRPIDDLNTMAYYMKTYTARIEKEIRRNRDIPNSAEIDDILDSINRTSGALYVDMKQAASNLSILQEYIDQLLTFE